ncbi:hypothetical protein L1887_21593 [Cichorium endivia]|nr:hypothetical protein L1887_21593 [Cichorium endivia]
MTPRLFLHLCDSYIKVSSYKHSHRDSQEVRKMSIDENDNELHLVMFPFLAFGHISPFVQLANKLTAYSGVRISFLAASANVRRIETMLNRTATTQIIALTLPHVDGLPEGIENTADTSPATVELLKVALDLMQPQIKNLLTDLNPNFVVFDFAQWWLPTIASEIGIRTICFSVFMAVNAAFVTAWFNRNIPPTIEEVTKSPPGWPGTITLRTFEALDFLYVFKSFHGTPSVIERLMKCFNGCDAILIKSSRETEGPYIDYFAKKIKKPLLHLVRWFPSHIPVN